MRKYEVTVAATYIGTIEVEATSAKQAQMIASTNVLNGVDSPDLTFSGYTSFDLGEEIE